MTTGNKKKEINKIENIIIGTPFPIDKNNIIGVNIAEITAGFTNGSSRCDLDKTPTAFE